MLVAQRRSSSTSSIIPAVPSTSTNANGGTSSSTHSATRWSQEKLFQILNYRYNAKLSTVITVGRPLEELPEAWVSRMYDDKVSLIFQIETPDYRGLRRPEPQRRRRQ